ncbi:MAG: hypothetical protein A3F72_13535 [Bacteroidetes bacterium RIFCSPLOWO2_12_FULL_35_15]|nr:MAG: hypothetical protein A3F72_13535 [Bacteroidetes bacterium RIFCSPLOWO2_12_FULL_35_15]
MPGCNESTCTPVTVTLTGTPASVTWNGANTGGLNNWFNNLNWTPNCLPSCGTNVSIPSGTPNSPDIGFSATYGAAGSKTLTLASGATLSFSDPKAELDVCADFIQNGTVTTNGKGKIVFMGSVTQNFTCSTTGSGDLNEVVLINTATPPLLKIKEAAGGTNKDMNITSGFTFQSGIVFTEGIRKLVIKNSSPASLSGGSVSGYVWGRLNRYVISGNAYDFPVGETPVTATAPNYPYELLNINFTSITGLNDLTVKFENPSTNAINTIASSTTSPGLSLNGGTEGTFSPLINCGGTNAGVGVNSMGGVWTVLPNAGTATYDITLYGRNFDNAGAGPTYWSVLKRSTYTNCATSPSWALDGVYSTNAISGNLVSASRTGMSGFSQFAIARTTVALPIELIAFDVTCTKENAKISWATASEINNNHFTLERSCDDLNSFTTIATIQGAGNSTSLMHYSFTDTDFPGAICYYRLSQTDNDGTTTYFNIIAASCELNSVFNLNNVLPNPTTNELHVLFTNNMNEPVYITITDMLGQEFLNKEILCERGLNSISLDLSTYSEGVYFLKINNGKKSFIKKIVKN